MVIKYLFFFALWPLLTVTSLKICKDNEIRYEQTECGSDGGRWHVAVPRKPGHCTVNNRQPIRQKSCDSSCPRGRYLDVSTLKAKCKLCRKGTYSVGSSVRYNNWTILPPEFDAYPIESFDDLQPSDENNGCNATWVADGYYLRTSGTSCIARLTYSTTIVQNEGSLTFSYYYSNKESSIYFETYVQNDQCIVSKQDDDDDDGDDDDDDGDDDDDDGDDDDGDDDDGDDGDDDDDDSDRYVVLKAPSETKFLNHTIKLKRGKNLIVWDVEDWNPQGRAFDNMVFINVIEVKGVSFSSECADCPAGTYGETAGSDRCLPCPENQISKSRAVKCTPCNQDTEYAPRGSVVCLPRKPCVEADYIEVMSECNKHNKFQTIYKWIEPKICSHTIDDAAKLPASGPKRDCPPCNPGTHLNGTKCLLCPPGTYSDGIKPCVKCPPSTAAVKGYNLIRWRNIPAGVDVWCSNSDNCATQNGWQARGDYVDSGFGHRDNARLYLEISPKGFSGESGLVSRLASAVGTLRIDFELDCDGSCAFTMYESSPLEISKVMTWTGRRARQNYTYAVTSKKTKGFFWRLTKTDATKSWSLKGKEFTKDRVKIYAIVLTNTLQGGASECQMCNVGLHKNGCIQCPEGHFFNHDTSGCQACESGTHLDMNGTCVKCGSGLTSTKASTRCYSNCHYHAKDGRHLDFTSLNGVHSAKTQKLFLPQGTPYFYEYRINLCGVNSPPARCHKNISFAETSKIGEKRFLNASICQMRIIPGKNDGRSISANIAGIGHQLMGIYEEKPENLSFASFDDDKLLNESLLYFDFLSHTTTTSCPSGRSAWIILRCDPEANEGVIKLPQECQEGTCDGCQFMFLWSSKYACPICTEKYYNKVVSGCAKRRQTIHYNWNSSPKGCVNGVELPKLQYAECNEMTVHEAVKQFQILIGIVAFAVTAIIASLIFLWCKNRVLKYKLYRRVAVTENDQAGELPDAPSCVADEEEEEAEKIEFRKGENPGKKLMKKLKDFSKKGGEEEMSLNESFEVDLN